MQCKCKGCLLTWQSGVQQYSFGCYFSYWKVMKGKSLGRGLCLLVLCKGLVLAPSQFQPLKCKEPNATRNSPRFLSSARMRAASAGKGEQKGVYTMRRA